MDGWSGSHTGTFTYANNSCSTGGSLTAALGDQAVRTANTDVATWAFTAPAGETLAAATLWRAGDAFGGSALNASYEFWEAAPGEHEVFDECVNGLGCSHEGTVGEPFANANRVGIPTVNTGAHVYLRASCGGAAEFECPTGQGDPNNYAAALYLYAADLTLEQAAGPTVSSVGGELASAATVTGTSDLTFTASDPGSGVYEVRFAVDGKVVQTTVPDEAGGSCRDVGQTTDGLSAFLHRQPCPASVSSDVAFDAAGLSPGPHHLVASVLDAAGNSAPLLDRTISIASAASAVPSSSSVIPGAPNGLGATTAAVLTARWQSTAKPRLLVPFGRAATILGRLTDPGGIPIAGAQITVSSTPAMAGAALAQMKGSVTSPSGTFVLRLPARLSSRTIALTYTAHAGDPAPAAKAGLQLAVKAPVSMSVAPRVVASQGTISFHGRLLAGPFPKGGKPVVLEARSGRGAWIEFHVARTDRRGRFKAHYRFKYAGPIRYQFRAVCEQEADYPFATGASPAVGVRER